MAELLDAHEARLDGRLDAGKQQAYILGVDRTPPVLVTQPLAPELPGTQSLAASAPGAVALNAGNGVNVRIRLERWSARPPDAAGSWTERDELPWQEVVHGGPLSIGAEDNDGLNVDGLGRARVVVLVVTARGSHDGEEWLLQFFPDPGRSDAMAGPPRVLSEDPFVRPKIAGPATDDSTESTYRRGLQVVREGGWHDVRYLGIQNLLTLLGIATAAVTRDELAAAMTYFPSASKSWDDVVFNPDWSIDRWPGEELAEDVSQLAAALEAAAEMATIRTASDSLECLLRLGVLVEDESDDGLLRISPSMTAPPIWEAVELPPGWLVTLRASLLSKMFGTPRDDLLHLIRWAPDGALSVTIRQVADRLALAPDLIRVTLAMMLREHLKTDQNLTTIDDDTVFDVRSDRWTAPTGMVEPRVASVDHDTLVGMLDEFVTPDEASDWLAYERPSARLARVEADERVAAVLGGLPRLPDDCDWPMLGDRPLYFLASLDLAAVHELLPDAPLPVAGWLNFFATDEPTEDQFPFVSAMYPASRAGWRVIYVAPGTATCERSYPESPGSEPTVPFRRISCGLLPEATVPTTAFEAGRSIGLEPDRLQAYLDARWQRVDRTRGPDHRIGGWADPAQSDPAAPVALGNAGLIDAQGRVHHRHEDATRLVANADNDWFLLLQLATDDSAGWMWGDGGVMFFYVEPDAARARDFTNVWMNWDCS